MQACLRNDEYELDARIGLNIFYFKKATEKQAKLELRVLTEIIPFQFQMEPVSEYNCT